MCEKQLHRKSKLCSVNKILKMLKPSCGQTATVIGKEDFFETFKKSTKKRSFKFEAVHSRARVEEREGWGWGGGSGLSRDGSQKSEGGERSKGSD